MLLFNPKIITLIKKWDLVHILVEYIDGKWQNLFQAFE